MLINLYFQKGNIMLKVTVFDSQEPHAEYRVYMTVKMSEDSYVTILDNFSEDYAPFINDILAFWDEFKRLSYGEQREYEFDGSNDVSDWFISMLPVDKDDMEYFAHVDSLWCTYWQNGRELDVTYEA